MSEIRALLERINRAIAAVPVLKKNLVKTPAPATRRATRTRRKQRALPPGIIQLAFSDLATDSDQDQAQAG